jgi:hypothetical protein
MRRPLAAILLTSPLLLAPAGCGRGPSDPPPDPGAARPAIRGVILISIDALRADQLGPYGYGRPTTPFLDRLAERSTVFENAFAQVPATLPSHMSMFTGLYPSEHQVQPPSSVLSDQIRTLPEILRKAGFRTFGHTEGGYVQGGYGFARGFEEWTDTPYAHDTDVERTFQAGLDSLARVKPGERFFLFLHSYTVHDPYDPPPAYRDLPWMGPRPAGAFDPSGPNFASFNQRRLAAKPAAIEWYRGLYDAGIRYLDDRLAAFFAELERSGLSEDTLVILTSDHGEEFGEHGYLVHTQAYPECLRIPLIVVAPGRPGARVARVVETVDFAPTLYELTGVAPPPGLSGESLAATIGRTEPGLTGFAYAENDLLGFEERSILQAVGGSLYQLYRAHAVFESDGFWVSRRVGFDAHPPWLELRAVAFPEPRPVTVYAGGRKIAEIEVGVDWGFHRIALPDAPGRVRIALETPECTAPASIGASRDDRCLSFKLRDTKLERLELFDLARDRLAQRDLSSERGDLVRTLGTALKRYPETARAPASQGSLSEEQVKHLKALGYL